MHCIFDRSSEIVCCVSATKVHCCKAVTPKEKNDEKFGGPAPTGDYLVGRRTGDDARKSTQKDWHRLYWKRKNGTYCEYDEGAGAKKNRNQMNLHPGRNSLGCVTCESDGCYEKIHSMIESGVVIGPAGHGGGKKIGGSNVFGATLEVRE